MSERLYLQAAQSLRKNEGQWEAYESQGHCVVLAGPGSGKTKTLTLKLARILAEDVAAPRGVACITYNNECARELESRLDQLGIEPGGRVFIGTVHSFSLKQILLPYAETAHLGLPQGFKVATEYDRRAALEEAFKSVIGGPQNPEGSRFLMDEYRRAFLDRTVPQWNTTNPQRAQLAEAYEKGLRDRGVIDFEDMPLLAVKALRTNPWLQRAILAKYPVLAVDEYQDLGLALHRMVLGLCFSTGIRLFAVGDADQSIYGFLGAEPQRLEALSERPDVKVVHLRLNYRCGSKIVKASSYALGEDRDYKAPDGAEQGTIYFHPGAGNYGAQADQLFATIIPEAGQRIPDLKMGQIAVLYPAATVGDTLQHAARRYGFETVRTDKEALYARSSPLMRWIETCAAWCSGGWQKGRPRFSKVVNRGVGLLREVVATPDQKIAFQRQITSFLWASRDDAEVLHSWLSRFRADVFDPLATSCRTLADEIEALEIFMSRVDVGGDHAGMTLGQFSGQGTTDRINLSTLHSAKGREFQVVVLFAMEEGRIPWNNPSPRQLHESQRLFYVGFTRAKSEVHMMFSAGQPSRFVREVERRIDAP